MSICTGACQNSTGGCNCQARGLPAHPMSLPQPKKVSMPAMGAWQCPGCFTFYPLWVGSCGCQRGRGLSSSTTFTTLTNRE